MAPHEADLRRPTVMPILEQDYWRRIHFNALNARRALDEIGVLTMLEEVEKVLHEREIHDVLRNPDPREPVSPFLINKYRYTATGAHISLGWGFDDLGNYFGLKVHALPMSAVVILTGEKARTIHLLDARRAQKQEEILTWMNSALDNPGLFNLSEPPLAIG